MFNKILWGIILGLFIGLNAAFPLTINVPLDQPTIQAGINAASNGDTIMVAGGNYSGPGNRSMDFLGKHILLKSIAGMDQTIVNCSSEERWDRGFVFRSGEDSSSVLDGFTIMGCNNFEAGGAVFINSSSPQILNCQFISNYCVGNGGAIYCNNSSAFLGGCNLKSNAAMGGGAIYCINSSITIENCNLDSNTAGSEDGGAISYDHSSGVMKNCRLSSNACGFQGGAINLLNSTLQLQNCLFAEDSAYYGAGIYAENSNLGLQNCTFAKNWAWFGSAILLKKTAATLERSILVFSDSGAAISYYASDMRPINISCCDIFGNRGTDWSGVLAPFRNSAGNMSFNPSFCDTATDDYSLDSLSVCAPWNNSCGVLIGAYPVECTNPNNNHPPCAPVSGFAPSGGESVYNFLPIIKWNAAIDSDPTDPPATLLYEIRLNQSPDLENNFYASFITFPGQNILYITDSLQPVVNWYYKIRVFDDQGRSSPWSQIQSFHILETLPYGGPRWFVALTGDDNSGYGSPEHPYASICLAVNSAHSGDTILVTPGRYSGVYNRDINFKDKSLFLWGIGGSGITTIDCGDPFQSAHRAILLSGALNLKSIIRGFRITGGSVSSDSMGGGIFCSSSWLELVNCTIDSCDAGSGGGIACYNGKIHVTGSAFDQNWGSYGAGIYCSNSQADISNCQFSENHSPALYLLTTPLSLTNCQFESNIGSGYLSGAEINISNCSFGSHKADAVGRHLTLAGIHGTISHCQFEFNIPGRHGNSGISMSNSRPNIRYCSFTHLNGSALEIGSGSNPFISSCQFMDNMSDNGGAARILNSSPTFENCSFIGNKASDHGGGIDAVSSSPVFRKCLFTGNRGIYGGAITLSASPASIENCTMVSDSGDWHGGEILCYSSSPIIKKCIISFSGYGEGLYCYDINSAPMISCTDIYGNHSGDWVGCIAGQANINGNFSLDPLYCDRPNVYFVVASNSPCAPEGNSCHALIGAFGYNCLWCGELVMDGNINIRDVTFLIRYLYLNGPAPAQLDLADVDNSGAVDLKDITYLINFIYRQGPAPNCP